MLNKGNNDKSNNINKSSNSDHTRQNGDIKVTE